MHGIVIITTNSGAKREFANRLYEESGGKVDLVIIQEPPPKRFLKRITDYVEKVGISGLPRELFFTILWFFSPRVRKAEQVLSLRGGSFSHEGSWIPRTLSTQSINTKEVQSAIAGVSPKLIVIWGGLIVKNYILQCAPRAINMHFGWCPYYRGVNGNQHAILNNDWSHIGVTIHYAVEKVDAGEVLSVIPMDKTKSVTELFRDLNDRGEAEYRNVARRLFRGEHLSSKPQDLSLGKNYRLKEWTFEKRFRLGKSLLRKD